MDRATRTGTQLRRWRGRWLAALGLVALFLAGCGDSDVESAPDESDVDVVASDQTTGDEDTAVATTEVSEAPEDDAAGTGAESAPIAAGAVYDPDAEPLLDWFAPFEPGTYRTGALGTPMSFTAAEALHTQPNGDGFFVVTDTSSRAPDDRDLVFIRVGTFADPAAPNAPIAEQTGWPNDDFLGWLENLHAGVIATEPVATTVNGMAAIQVDLQLSDDIECGWLPGSCAGFVANNGHDIKALNKGASYRVWVVEQGDEDPLAIIAGIARDADAEWFDRAAAVLDTVAFGAVAPNPVQPLDGGPNSLAALGGVEVVLPDNIAQLTNGRPRLIHRWTGRQVSMIPITESPAVIYFADRPHDMDGTPLASIDDVVSQLTVAGAQLTELDATTIDGVDARAFDVTHDDVGAILLRFSPLDVAVPVFGWDAPAAGRMWVMEHPDRGVMMVSTHAFGEVDELLPQVNAVGEAIVGSLTFAS